MTDYILSKDAEQDITDIYLYSIETFGLAKADEYVGELFGRFSALAAKPTMGKLCDEVTPGLRRLRQTSHMIYYRMDGEGVFILRILHG